MRLSWLVPVLRAAGLQVEESDGWLTRGKDPVTAPMSPQVVVAHHTATSPTTADSAVTKLLINGRSDLPGPLCHLGLTRTGKYVAIASGIANHAGAGGWQGFTGNRKAVGIEAYNSGLGEPWPAAQLDAYDRGVAAILKHLGLPAIRLCGHKEWAPTRKTDPRGIDMNAMRGRVTALMSPKPPTHVLPRRFAEVFQIDDKLHGTLVQQQAIRDALTVPFGSKQHALLHEFDVYYNRTYKRSYVNIEIKDFGSDVRNLELAGAGSIAFSDKLVPAGIKPLAPHSIFHVFDNTDYITQQDREWFMSAVGVVSDWNQCRETWADAGRDWWQGVGWTALDGILLRERT